MRLVLLSVILSISGRVKVENIEFFISSCHLQGRPHIFSGSDRIRMGVGARDKALGLLKLGTFNGNYGQKAVPPLSENEGPGPPGGDASG